MAKKLPKRKIWHPKVRINSEDIEKLSTREECDEMMLELNAHIADADDQIGTAKGIAASNGEYMEPVAYQKLLGYRCVLGFLHQKTIFRVRELNALAGKSPEQKKQTLSNFFMEVARKRLSATLYEEIRSQAISIKEQLEKDENSNQGSQLQ